MNRLKYFHIPKSFGKNYNLKLFKKTIISYYNHEGLGWLDIFGFCIIWKDSTKHELTFSERRGIKKYIKLGKWRISI